MAELISMYFNALIAEVTKLTIPHEYKDDMLGKLQFLRTQSLCDYERRKPTSELREVWKNVDRAMAQHGLYERYKPSKKAWETIGMFVEIAQFRPTPTRRMAAAAAPLSPYAQMGVTQLFEAMNSACSGITFIQVRTSIRNALKFLEDESKKPPEARDQKQIVETWKRIHPELKKARDFTALRRRADAGTTYGVFEGDTIERLMDGAKRGAITNCRRTLVICRHQVLG